MPARIFIRVDLPAPFSPMSAWTSPARRSNRADFRACTPGNRFSIPRISMIVFIQQPSQAALTLVRLDGDASVDQHGLPADETALR